MIRRLMFVTLLVLLSAWTRAESVKLRWNPNPEPDIAGYRINYSTADGSNQSVNTGNVTRYTITGLEGGATYRMTLQAVNTSGLESDPTEPITVTTPMLRVSSEAPQFPKAALIDGKPLPIFATFYEPEPLDHAWIEMELSEPCWIGGIRYLPRQDQWQGGHIESWAVLADGREVISGRFETHDRSEKAILFQPREATTIRLQSDQTHLTASEFSLIYRQPPMQRITPQWSDDAVTWHDLPSAEIPDAPRRLFRFRIERPNATIETP